MKYKFILEGLVLPAFENQNDWRKKKRQWEQLYEVEMDSILTRSELLQIKYAFVPRGKRNIEKAFKINIPLRLGKIRWRIIDSGSTQ